MMEFSPMRPAGAALHTEAQAKAAADPMGISMARMLVVIALIGAPLAIGAVEPWAWILLGLLAYVALFLWALGSVQQGALRFVWSPLYIPLIVFLLWGLVQYWGRFTLDRSATRESLVLLAVDGTLFFLTAQLYATAGKQTWRGLGLAVVAFAGLLALFSILQFASGTHRIYGRIDTPAYLFGPYVNPDHYAGLMEMLIPVAALYIVGQRKRLPYATLALLLFAAAVALASLLLSGSRAGLIALSVEVAMLFVIFGFSGPRKTEGARLAMVVATTLLAGALLFSWEDPGWVLNRLSLLTHVKGHAWTDEMATRKSFAKDSLRMLLGHPVSGVGLGSFMTAYPSYQSYPSDWWVNHAHNDYVEAAAETGIVGVAAVLTAMALFFHLAFAGLARRVGTERGLIRLGAAIGCCGLLVHSFFDFNLHIPANAAWFAVLAGLATTADFAGAKKNFRYEEQRHAAI